jgi:hypothetical protein
MRELAAWHLVTLHVRFVRVEERRAPSDAELDRLAEFLIGLDNVATVRVEPVVRPTVLRIDVRASTTQIACALAVQSLDRVRQKLALEPQVEAMTID